MEEIPMLRKRIAKNESTNIIGERTEEPETAHSPQINNNLQINEITERKVWDSDL